MSRAWNVLVVVEDKYHNISSDVDRNESGLIKEKPFMLNVDATLICALLPKYIVSVTVGVLESCQNVSLENIPCLVPSK